MYVLRYTIQLDVSNLVSTITSSSELPFILGAIWFMLVIVIGKGNILVPDEHSLPPDHCSHGVCVLSGNQWMMDTAFLFTGGLWFVEEVSGNVGVRFLVYNKLTFSHCSPYRNVAHTLLLYIWLLVDNNASKTWPQVLRNVVRV